MPATRLLLVVVALALGSYACTAETGRPFLCNTLVNDGPTITVMTSSDPAPVPLGGGLVDGTYDFSAGTFYGPATVDVPTIRAVLEISGRTMQQVGSIDGDERRYSSTWSISGTTLSTTDTCPTSYSESFEFTATATELRIYGELDSGILEQIYTRRGVVDGGSSESDAAADGGRANPTGDGGESDAAP